MEKQKSKSKDKVLDFLNSKSSLSRKNIPIQSSTVKKVERLKVSLDTDRLALTGEDSFKIKKLEKTLEKYKMDLCDLELHILELEYKKQQLSTIVVEKNKAMFDEIRNIAESHGIDVDGVNDDRKWNLNSDMTFYRVK